MLNSSRSLRDFLALKIRVQDKLEDFLFSSSRTQADFSVRLLLSKLKLLSKTSQLLRDFYNKISQQLEDFSIINLKVVVCSISHKLN